MTDQKPNKPSSSNTKLSKALPPIPEKRYFTIGEVSQLCELKPHILRYWEQEFPQLKPSKRRGNRRYYQQHEVIFIRNIRYLLYELGYTIDGARNYLKNQANKSDSELSPSRWLSQIIYELKKISQILNNK